MLFLFYFPSEGESTKLTLKAAVTRHLQMLKKYSRMLPAELTHIKNRKQ